MSYRGKASVVLFLFAASGCGPDTKVEWGPPTTKSNEQRPTNWNTSTKDRLGLPEMGGATQGGPKTFVAQSPPDVWAPQPPQPAVFKDLVWKIASDPATECYLTAEVRGGVGGNLGRWFGQFGQTDVPAIEALPVIELAGKPGRLVELSGNYKGSNPGFAMMLAFVADGDSVTTLKFTGPEATVKAHRDSFVALAKSLRSASPSPDPKAPPIQRGQPLPDGHPPVPDMGSDPHGQAPAAPAGPLQGTAPAGWQPKSGSSKWLHHTFGDGGEVYASTLGGSAKSNLEIWRMEMSQPALDDAAIAALPKVPMLGGEGLLLDVSGDHRSMTGKQLAGARMLVVALPEGNGITFAKLVGKAAEVEAQRAAFLDFCKSLRRAQ